MQTKPRYQKGNKIGGRYQVHQALMGGMGEVYLCLDLEGMYPCALKTFQHRHQSQTLRQAFKKEVATWVALEKHPNIVRCFHMDTLDNQPFMVLEWIVGEESKGVDLRSWLRHGPLRLQLALEIALDIVYGLRHAQQKQPGIVHRDLKPENILMAQSGLAKITDFGLAQIVANREMGLVETTIANQHGEQQHLIRRGNIVGTPAYMPPEQWRGEPLDVRSDIYALGCILYELVTGQQPFTVPYTPTTRHQHNRWLGEMQIQHETSSLPILVNSFSVDLANLLQNCLAKKITNRPSTLSQLQENLTQLYQQQFTKSPPKRLAPKAFSIADYNNRGLTYGTLQLYEQALADFNRAMKLDPKFALVYNNRGMTYYELNQYEQALTDYNRAIELEPQLPQAYCNRGNIYSKLQQYKQALTDYNRAIAFDDRSAVAYANRGNLYRDLQQHNRALADYDRAIELNPKLAQTYYNRGNLYRDLQQHNQALANYSRAIELNPEDIEAYCNRGNTYRELQKHGQALVDFNRAIELNPNNAIIYSDRGLVYHDLQQYPQALADLKHAIALNPEYPTAYYNRGIIHGELQQHERALADYSRAIELNPNDAQAYYNRGNTYRELQDYTRALADYNQAVDLNPHYTIAYSNRGTIYSELQQHTQALADYSQAIALDPEYIPAYYNRGNTYRTLQQYKRALADFRQVIALDPNIVQAYIHSGTLLATQGQLREALPYFEKAAQLGSSQAGQTVTQIKQELNVIQTAHTNPTRLAFEAFQRASSLNDMQKTVITHPLLQKMDVIVAIEQSIEQIPNMKRHALMQRLAWLKQIVIKQGQTKKHNGLLSRLFKKRN